jgi:hypothetical protein
VYTTAEQWPGLPIRRGSRRQKAADIADGTWPDLAGKIKPNDDRHTHATWLDVPDIPKVLQMDRHGHVMAGMDASYLQPLAGWCLRGSGVPEHAGRIQPC